MSNNRKSFELDLPYYKRGDDLGFALRSVTENKTGTPASELARDAFLQHAEMLEMVAKDLRTLAENAIPMGIEIENADTHFIGLTGPDDMMERLGNSCISLSNAHYWDDDEDEMYDDSHDEEEEEDDLDE